MADSALVRSSNETFDRHSVRDSCTEKPVDTSVQQGKDTPVTEIVKLDGMSYIRDRLQNRGISEKTSKILMASWRCGTQKQYKTYIKKWILYCAERKTNKFLPSVEFVLEFLTYLYEAGLSYSALNSARSALSAFGLTFDNIPIGKHPLVVRFLKGVFNLKPVVHRNVHIWDVSIVLTLLRRMSPVSELSLKDLTHKLVTLIALTNASRAQTIQLLKISNMEKHSDCFRFVMTDLLKQSRVGYKNPDILLSAYPPDRRLCVYFVMKEYLKRTSDFRSNTDSFILSYIKPYKPVTSSTISRWIKTVLCRAGIDTTIFKAHSTRAASTSKAKNKDVPICDILSKAGWSNSKTFGKFYDKKICDDDVFAMNVLQD